MVNGGKGIPYITWILWVICHIICGVWKVFFFHKANLRSPHVQQICISCSAFSLGEGARSHDCSNLTTSTHRLTKQTPGPMWIVWMDGFLFTILGSTYEGFLAENRPSRRVVNPQKNLSPTSTAKGSYPHSQVKRHGGSNHLQKVDGTVQGVWHKRRIDGKWFLFRVSKNGGTPKSSILIGCSIINHPFWCISIFGNTNFHLLFGFGVLA